MPLLLDVLEVLAGRTLGRIVLAHVTQTPGEFGESLAVGAVAHPRHREMLRAGKAWTRDEREDRLGVEVHQGRGKREEGSGKRGDAGCGKREINFVTSCPTSGRSSASFFQQIESKARVRAIVFDDVERASRSGRQWWKRRIVLHVANRGLPGLRDLHTRIQNADWVERAL